MKDEDVIYSHLYKKDNGEWKRQTNEEHSKNVAKLAEKFASAFGMGEWGRALGMLHDKGKESAAFQQYIRKSSGYDEEVKYAPHPNHAFVGGAIAKQLYGKNVENIDNLLVNQIISHHTELHDTNEIDEIVNQKIPEGIEVNVLREQLDDKILKDKCESEDLHHISRMFYSCLIDADRLDAERVENEEIVKFRGSNTTLEELWPKLEARFEQFKKSKKTAVNDIRRKVQEQCLKMANSDKGFYSLTVPTGGGKTLSSVAWAIRHAINHNLRRIIIAAPFTTIITQTADELRKIFGEENVLEHHSNIIQEADNEENNDIKQRAKLATENWDYPIIVTTNVQLFESMFSNQPSVCRKLHNIASSVVILDEVQTLPIGFLQPIVDALKTYNRLFNVSFLFTTASQPILSGNIISSSGSHFNGIEHIAELIPENFDLPNLLKRVDISFDEETSDYDSIAKRMAEHRVVLCIVNTRKDALEIYNRLPKEGLTLHLSRMMYPSHVSATIDIIKTALKSKYPIIRVVSTQLVEAGVDIDFPVVFRQIAGYDSILQAAGRCNREGNLETAPASVFRLEKELAKGMIGKAISATKELLADGITDYFSPDTITAYFKKLYAMGCDFDKKRIWDEIGCMPNRHNKHIINFREIAKLFKLIEDDGCGIIVQTTENENLIKEIRGDKGNYKINYNTIKKLMRYVVNVRKWDFEELKKAQIIQELKEGSGIYCTIDSNQYSYEVGLKLNNKYLEELQLADIK